MRSQQLGYAALLIWMLVVSPCSAQPAGLQPDLVVPAAVAAKPTRGKRVIQRLSQYRNSDIYHLLYLPTDWVPDKKYPVIVEYAGNEWKTSPGTVEGSNLGYGISGGEGIIWICMPFVNQRLGKNQLNWWGDIEATVEYCKRTVELVCAEHGGDPEQVFVAGFSRGAIACNYIGLHDDEIAKLWRGFICFSHYDGVRKWNYPNSDQVSAAQRLARLGNRPQFICQENSVALTRKYLSTTFANGNFTFQAIQGFPHTDTWVLYDVPERKVLREWIQQAIAGKLSGPTDLSTTNELGQLIFFDDFERQESQEVKDEPGNGWTTSSDKTAGGNKQVDLRDGVMFIYTHATANHATSVRHTMSFRDGSLGLKFKLRDKTDSLKLNFTDLGCKTVHAGHLFNAEVGAGKLVFIDRKTGEMDLEIRAARKAGHLTAEQKKALTAKRQSSRLDLQLNVWHDLRVDIRGDLIKAFVNGVQVGEFRSDGIAHPTKTMIRFLVPRNAAIDEVRIWRLR